VVYYVLIGIWFHPRFASGHRRPQSLSTISATVAAIEAIWRTRGLFLSFVLA
jgi:hypothetical protein